MYFNNLRQKIAQLNTREKSTFENKSLLRTHKRKFIRVTSIQKTASIFSILFQLSIKSD